MKEAIRITVSGAAGRVAYSLLPKLADGSVFGSNQPIDLILLELPQMLDVLQGVVMELHDCSFPLLKEVITTADVDVAFKDIDVAILIGAMPRVEGMERRDLLSTNVKIFKQQGQAIDKFAKKTVKVLVVGNPANTNANICRLYASSIPAQNFTALTRLDQNRALSQVASKLGVSVELIENVVSWGNHSSILYADAQHATVKDQGKVKSAIEAIGDESWVCTNLSSAVQSRPVALLKSQKIGSALSASKAVCDHMRDWWFGTQGRWVSMGVVSDGNSYGVPDGLVYSFPLTVDCNGDWHMVRDLIISGSVLERIDANAKQLEEEKDEAFAALSNL